MTESMQDLLVRLATDPEFAGTLGDDAAALAARHGLTVEEAATVLAAKVDTGSRGPARLEERLSRSGMVFGADVVPPIDVHLTDADVTDTAAEPQPAPSPVVDFQADDVAAEPVPAPEPAAERGPPPDAAPAPEPEAAAPPASAPPAPEEPPADSAEPEPAFSPRFVPDFHTLESEPPPASPAEPATETNEIEPQPEQASETEAGTETGPPDLASPGDDGYGEQAPSSAVVSTETDETENGTETHITYRDGSEDITVVHPDGSKSATHTVPTPNGSLAVITSPDGSTSYAVTVDNTFTNMFGVFDNTHTYSADDPNVHTVTNSDGSTVTTINTPDRDRHTITVYADGATTYDHMIRNEDGTYAKVTSHPNGPSESGTVSPPKPEAVSSDALVDDRNQTGVWMERITYADGTTSDIDHNLEYTRTYFHRVSGPDGLQLEIFMPDEEKPSYTVAGHSLHLGDPGLIVTINDNGTENVYITLPDGSQHYVFVDDNGASTYVHAEPNGDGTYTQTTRFPDGHTETEILVPEG